jgi:hypothetical protein
MYNDSDVRRRITKTTTANDETKHEGAQSLVNLKILKIFVRNKSHILYFVASKTNLK